MKSLIPNLMGKSCLELGCAGAIYSRLMRKHSATQITSYDYSSELIEEAKKVANFVNYEQRDINDVWQIKNKFDFCCASFILHYSEDLKLTLRNIKDSLKSNGEFLFSIPNPQLNYDGLLEIKNIYLKVNKEKITFNNYPISLIAFEVAKLFTIQKCIVNQDVLIMKCKG